MIQLADLGLTQDELRDRVVDQICDQLLMSKAFDGDGEYNEKSEFARNVSEQVKKRIDTTVTNIADQHVLPRVREIIESTCLQATNKWGEAKGEKLTFIEYLVHCAEKYINEDVNFEGKPKGADSYGWTKSQTRITHMIHQYLHHSIEFAMKEAIGVANSTIAKALHETAKIKLNEIAASLKVNVQTK